MIIEKTVNVINETVNFINKIFNFLQSKFLNIVLFFLDIFRNNVSGFFQFMFEKNIIMTAIAFIVSTQVTKLITSFIQIFVDPIIKRLSVGKVESLENFEITIYDVKIKIGLFLNTLFAFSITFFIIYQIYLFSINPDMSGILDWLRKAETRVIDQSKQKNNVVISVGTK
jgi:large-conductance mechanosensitive channel